MDELPPMPDIRPDEEGRYALARWKEKWREFRNAVVDHLTEVFDETDGVEILAGRLQSLGERLGSDPDRSWNEIVDIDEETDTIVLQIDRQDQTHKRLGRKGDVWWFADKQQPTDQDTRTDIHRSLALKLVSDLFFWGDLGLIYKSMSWDSGADGDG